MRVPDFEFEEFEEKDGFVRKSDEREPKGNKWSQMEVR
jgi:hypothetical protein